MTVRYHDHPYIGLNAHIDELRECYEAIEQAHTRLRQVQERQPDILNTALQKARVDGDLKTLAQYLYLDAPEGISRNTVKVFISRLGQKGGQQWLCEGYTYAMPCSKCGTTFDYAVKSFTDLQDVSTPPRPRERPYNRTRRERTCPPCERAARQESDEKTQQYVREMAACVRQLRSMPYQEYLQTDHWQSIRSRALRQAQFRCQLCNASGQLHVHHRSYEHRGEEQHYMHDVIVLCHVCHAKHHDIED